MSKKAKFISGDIPFKMSLLLQGLVRTELPRHLRLRVPRAGRVHPPGVLPDAQNRASAAHQRGSDYGPGKPGQIRSIF
jgi:hypothetical protein